MPRPPRSRWRATRFLIACAVTYACLALARGPGRSQIATVVVVGSMGSGTAHTTRELRALGLDVMHERTGRDGAVGYAHALLYVDPLADKERDPLCSKNLKRAWHPQLFVDVRALCGDVQFQRGGLTKHRAACWQTACPAAARRWRGCGAKDTCPLRLASKPIILVRHPLRTLESLSTGFCTDARLAANGTSPVAPQILAHAHIVGMPEEAPARVSCALAFARVWVAYYGALETLVKRGMVAGVVQVEHADGACAIVAKAVAATKPAPPRLTAAAEMCANNGRPWRAWLPALRERFERAIAVGPFDDGANRRNQGRLRLSWRDLRRVDKQLAAEMGRLAKFYGYDRPRAGDRLRPH